jgi:hypothetical protein
MSSPTQRSRSFKTMATMFFSALLTTSTSAPLPYIGDPTKNSLMTNIPMYDAAGSELGKQWWEPKFKTPMDVTTEADPYGYNPYARHGTEFIDPKSNPSTLHIPDFSETIYTWPMPIVSGPPGKNTHKNAAARTAAPRIDLNKVVPNQSGNTPYPMINQVAKWPHYPGVTTPDWLHVSTEVKKGGGGQ